MKLWEKNIPLQKEVESFTIGKDREMDVLLAPFDVLGSLAHIQMLESVGLLSKDELTSLRSELKKIYQQVTRDGFKLDEEAEDIHSNIESLLTKKLGEAGKKIHSARSRNDQVLLDIRLYLRHEIETLVTKIISLFELLQSQSEKYKDHLLPGYSHLQLAMPSSFGLWFGAYGESLVDDMITLKASFDVINKNPLGSAAGFGSSFPINRTMTTTLLGFETLNYNVVYAQMGRGKTERIVAMSLANLADTFAKLSMDACIYLSQDLGFISFPAELTTGSSIMPHKKNPDVFELVRAHCNRLRSLPNEIMMMTTNLTSGYHRDLQLLKENLFPAFRTLSDCTDMISLMLSHIQVKEGILQDEKYKYLFSVEEANKLVLQGIPFRDAYKKIGIDIELGNFSYDPKNLKHTHEGSIGNLNNKEIKKEMDKITGSFPFNSVRQSIDKLLE
jgi:argininosuccinate lyase